MLNTYMAIGILRLRQNSITKNCNSFSFEWTFQEQFVIFYQASFTSPVTFIIVILLQFIPLKI